MADIPAADFYFDPVSPFAFLMWRALRVDDLDLAVRPVPVLLGGLLDHWGLVGPAEVAPKRLATYRLCQWLAQEAGIALRFPDRHPFRSLDALRLIVACDASAAAIDTVFDAVFIDGRDLGDPREIARLGSVLGLGDTGARIADPAVKQRLRDHGAAAVARGVFGVPTLAIGDLLFWGYDTLAMIRAWRADPQLLDRPAMRRLATLEMGIAPRRPA